MPPINRITIIGCSLLLLILLLMGVWYGVYVNNQPTPQPSPSPSTTPFSETNQVVPQGATSLSVNEALNAFNLPKPLPFFDERNVVQSLGLSLDVSASPTAQPQEKSVAGGQNASSHTQPQNVFSPFLSYRISEQSKEAIQTAFIEYFKGIGWKTAGRPLVFSSDTHQIVTITLFDVMGQQAIIVALSMP